MHFNEVCFEALSAEDVFLGTDFAETVLFLLLFLAGGAVTSEPMPLEFLGFIEELAPGGPYLFWVLCLGAIGVEVYRGSPLAGQELGLGACRPFSRGFVGRVS